MPKEKNFPLFKIYPWLFFLFCSIFGIMGCFHYLFFGSSSSKNAKQLPANLIKTNITGEASSEKPSGYMTLHPAYGRATGADQHGNWGLSSADIRGHISKFRVFIPPGTQGFDLRILEYGGQTAVVHHETPPTSDPVFPAGYKSTQPYKLSELEADECYAKKNMDNQMWIADNNFASPYLSLDRGGWLYVKVDSHKGSNSYGNKFSITVNTEAYNNWFDNYGSNADGSIDWEKDVESVVEYKINLLKGDIEPATNPDGDVDIFDYNIFIQNWGKTATDNPADIDKNGKVDIFDYNLLVGNFGTKK